MTRAGRPTPSAPACISRRRITFPMARSSIILPAAAELLPRHPGRSGGCPAAFAIASSCAHIATCRWRGWNCGAAISACAASDPMAPPSRRSLTKSTTARKDCRCACVAQTSGREALATCAMVHDKMRPPGLRCGDHCNMLPYTQGTDEHGNPAGTGLATHVKGEFQAAGGP